VLGEEASNTKWSIYTTTILNKSTKMCMILWVSRPSHIGQQAGRWSVQQESTLSVWRRLDVRQQSSISTNQHQDRLLTDCNIKHTVAQVCTWHRCVGGSGVRGTGVYVAQVCRWLRCTWHRCVYTVWSRLVKICIAVKVVVFSLLYLWSWIWTRCILQLTKNWM